MSLNKKNYYSSDANREYMSVSLFKSFLPQYGGCEAKAVAKLTGEWQEQSSEALLLGSYVHAWNEGKLEEFKQEHPELFKKDGTLYAKYAIGDSMIHALESDPFIEKVREGEKEVIITGELLGVPWKGMIDIYNPSNGTFADLKTVRDIYGHYWNDWVGEKQNFIYNYGYHIQMGVYAELERQMRKSSKLLVPHIIAVSKEDPPDKAVINFGTEFVDEVMFQVELHLPHVVDVWKGKEKPIRCERCDYCRATKKVTSTMFFDEL